MSIQAECEYCGKKYSLSERYAGRQLPCKECGEPFDVPEENWDDAPPRRRSQRSTSSAPAPARSRRKPKPSSKKRSRPKRRKSQSNPQLFIGIGGGIAAIAVLGLLAFLIGGSSSTEANAQKSIDHINELADVLGNVTDEQSARDALPKIQRICDDMIDLAKKEKGKKLTRAENDRLMEKFKPKLMEASRRMEREVTRIRSNPAAFQIIQPPILQMGNALVSGAY